jgi:toxin YoeB
MPYSLKLRTEVQDHLDDFKKGSKQDYIKCFDLIRAILLNPRDGIGKPERLKHISEHDIEIYSRRVNEKDRLIYALYEETETIEIISCKGHYDDK